MVRPRRSDHLPRKLKRLVKDMNAEIKCSPSGLYPLKTAAAILGISRRTLKNYRDAGLIPTHERNGNRQKIIVGKDLIAFFNRRHLLG